MVRNRQGELHIERKHAPVSNRRGAYLNVQVIESPDGDSSTFTIYHDDEEFLSLEHGSDLFTKVTSFVLRKRRSGQIYPIFIADMDLPAEMFGNYSEGQVPTADILNYKEECRGQVKYRAGGFG